MSPISGTWYSQGMPDKRDKALKLFDEVEVAQVDG